ncbi:MAG: hypothetical protein JRH08_12615 [Deltaproteobacteria bacterium]|nr:hypothetical protein [Deltaproteobacteria bacterium]MBW1929618.1 hypothetical protein [Deltaproteobacteria bacterium]MBW2025836.1 hypothetical protein [Deltaproteobacteria bacterium]MBW2126509.1 hypothetical protein [Deltaproteobacteria bacterium]RLB19518.1 MAG: hypothetical protein DRG63_00835 [Deltaproteobacteria bacterium]
MNWKEKLKLCLWGAAGGAVLLAIIGFTVGGWVKGSTAQRMAEETATEAVVARLAPICVLQFMQDPNRQERLKELKQLESWKTGDYVKTHGWAIMPGEKEADYNVANECARRLAELEM